MKFKLILLSLIILSIRAYSQSNNNISVVYGVSNANVDIHDAIGDYGYNSKTGIVYGLTYIRDITSYFSIETGLLFVNDKVELTQIIAGMGNVITDGNVKMVSVPLYGKFTFLRYFYADAGFSIDNQSNYMSNSAVNDQSGIGLEFGIGGKYTVGQVTIFVNPYMKEYEIFRFSGSANNNLGEVGLKFGIGYNF